MRIILDEAIKEATRRFAGIKIQHIKWHGDESVLLVQGYTKKEELRAVLTAVREAVVRRSFQRLGVANLTNVLGAPAEKLAQISEVVGEQLILWGGRYNVYFDIYHNENLENAFTRTLAEWNQILLRKYGFVLRADAAQDIEYLPAISVTMGAVDVSGSRSFDEIFKDVSEQLHLGKASGRNRVALEGYDETVRPVEIQSVVDHPKGKDLLGSTKSSQAVTAVASDEAIIVLKGGEFGGLDYQTRELVLNKLREDFELVIGSRGRLTIEQILTVWGATGIKDRLESLRDSLAGTQQEAAVNLAIAWVANNTASEFDRWIAGIMAGLERKDSQFSAYSNVHFGVLNFLWEYLKEDKQLVL